MAALQKMLLLVVGSPLGSDDQRGKIYLCDAIANCHRPEQLRRLARLYRFLTENVHDALFPRTPRAAGEAFFRQAYSKTECFIVDRSSQYGGAVLCFRVFFFKWCTYCKLRRLAHVMLCPVSFPDSRILVRGAR